METLASIEDICSREGLVLSDLTDLQKNKIETLLQDASAYVRRESKQNFTKGTYQAVLKPGNKFASRLTQKPVIRVTKLNDEEVDKQPWEIDFNSKDDIVIVQYEAGYEIVPADIVALVCGIVQRTMNVNKIAKTGVSQHSVGPYSISFAGWAVGGNITLNREERRVLAGYKIPIFGRISR